MHYIKTKLKSIYKQLSLIKNMCFFLWFFIRDNFDPTEAKLPNSVFCCQKTKIWFRLLSCTKTCSAELFPCGKPMREMAGFCQYVGQRDLCKSYFEPSHFIAFHLHPVEEISLLTRLRAENLALFVLFFLVSVTSANFLVNCEICCNFSLNPLHFSFCLCFFLFFSSFFFFLFISFLVFARFLLFSFYFCNFPLFQGHFFDFPPLCLCHLFLFLVSITALFVFYRVIFALFVFCRVIFALFVFYRVIFALFVLYRIIYAVCIVIYVITAMQSLFMCHFCNFSHCTVHAPFVSFSLSR